MEMIKHKATVIADDNDIIWVDIERSSTCDQCQVNQGCGTGMLKNHVGKRFSRIAVAKKTSVSVGQQVHIGIPEKSLVQGAFIMYLLPLVIMFLFSASAEYLALQEEWEIIMGVSGLLIGFYIVHLRFRKNKTNFQAHILEEKQ